LASDMNYNSFRFQELERYDPLSDEQAVRCMCITDKGSFHTERPCPAGASRRDMRKLFRETTLDLMERGIEPCEVNLG
jgi:hypothetical protein